MNNNIDAGIDRRPVLLEQRRKNVLICIKASSAVGLVLLVLFIAYAIFNLPKDDRAGSINRLPKAPYTWPIFGHPMGYIFKDHMKSLEKFKPTEMIPEPPKAKTDIKMEEKN